jgi:hypothetical protein
MQLGCPSIVVGVPSIVTVVPAGAAPVPGGCVPVGAALAVCDDVVVDLVVDDRALVLFADAPVWSLLLPLLRNSTHTTATIAPNRITLRVAMMVNAVRDDPVPC